MKVKFAILRASLSGIFYNDAVLVKDKIKVGQEVELEAQVHNIHDPNAIAVRIDGVQIGWVPKEKNEVLHAILSNGVQLEAYITSIQSVHTNYVAIAVYMVAQKT
jgi:hypothetical protein